MNTVAQYIKDIDTNRDSILAHFSSDESALTYEEHYKGASRVASRLVERLGNSEQKAARVLIVSPTSENLLVALSGCWLCGAIAAPADIQLSNVAFKQLVQQLKPDALLIDKQMPKSVDLEKIALEKGCSVIENISEQRSWFASDIDVEIDKDDPALVIFTSGSTGLPKGVLLSQHNLVLGGQNVVNVNSLTASDKALCVLPLSHLNGLMTTFVSPMVSKSSVVYLQGSSNPMQILTLLDKYQCTWFSAVPTQYSALMKPPVDKKRWCLKKLRFCRSASFSLHTKLHKEFETYYGVPIIETMGMSETAAQIFSNPHPPQKRKHGSVGQPIGFEVRIVKDGNVCDVGDVGEIQIKGPGLMSGYLDSEAETANAFDGEWLKSGDLGYSDKENYFFITGRKKDIAIFGGINISLRHLENTILDAKLVNEISCVAEKDDDFGERVVAYLEANGDSETWGDTGLNVIKSLGQMLPNRMALKEVRFVKAFPRSSVGKILKGKLGGVDVVYKTDLMQALSSARRNVSKEVVA